MLTAFFIDFKLGIANLQSSYTYCLPQNVFVNWIIKFISGKCVVMYFSLNYTGYGGFDDYGGYNNYGYGNDGFDDRMRDGRGKINIRHFYS